jgi:hypothetical protein
MYLLIVAQALLTNAYFFDRSATVRVAGNVFRPFAMSGVFPIGMVF